MLFFGGGFRPGSPETTTGLRCKAHGHTVDDKDPALPHKREYTILPIVQDRSGNAKGLYHQPYGFSRLLEVALTLNRV